MASHCTLIKDTFYCRCAKEFEVKSSAKIKKKKRRECETATDRNCNLTVNRGFQEDEEIQPNTKNRSSLTPFMEIDDLQSNSCRRSTKKETDAEVTKSKRFKRGNFHSTEQGKNCVIEVREAYGEHIQNGEKEKVSLLFQLKSKLTKRKILAVMCPCFTYLILKGESKEKVANDEMRQDDMHRQVMR